MTQLKDAGVELDAQVCAPFSDHLSDSIPPSHRSTIPVRELMR
jgi:hypothetical protein